jgi:undecaprenyl-diphosphatase
MASLETQPAVAGHAPATRDRAPADAPGGVPVLCARTGGPAERVAGAFRGHAVVAFLVTLITGFVLIAALSTGMGFFVTRVVEHAWGIGGADERVDVWLAAHRTSGRTHASWIGSTVAGGLVLPVLVGAIALVCAVLRKWLIAAFVVFALAIESATYRATTIFIHSHRPRVVRLEHLPVNASYPSGHTAASIAVYGGLVLLITSRFTNGALRVLAWSSVVAMVVFVATSRMYRGMHHPLDVAGGVLVGIVALLVVVFACRVAGAASDVRNADRP